MKNYLIPECFTELELLLILGFSQAEEIIKASGCSSVIASIKNGRNQGLAIGWIDQDPTKRNSRGKDYFEYKEVQLPNYNIRLLQKPGKPHYLIEVVDDFEKWFEPIGKQRKVKKEDYNIQQSLSSLKSKKLSPKVKEYMNAVVKANPEPFNHIRSIIDGILEKHKL